VIWREKRNWFIALGLLLALNVFVFFTYRVRQQARIDELQTKRDGLEKTLFEVKGQRLDKQRQLDGYGRMVKDVEHIYDDIWSSSDKRLTSVLTELYRLAQKSNLTVQSYSYNFESADKEKRTTTMSVTYGVKGSYSQVRQLINLLENSDQFLLIDQIALSGEVAASDIQLRLTIRTLFGEPLKEGGAKS
jgi:Tfp pilus assembly protein PilO